MTDLNDTIQRTCALFGDKFAVGTSRVVHTTEGPMVVKRTATGYQAAHAEPFDRVVVISLDTANGRERLARFFERLEAVNWPWKKPEVFRAIEGRRLPKPRGWKANSGAWGCLRSHMAVLEQAMLDGVKRLLVLEDDAEFAADIATRGPQFMAAVATDWEQLMLGGQLVPRGPAVLKELVAPGVLRVAGVERTHAYAVRGAMMADLYTAWAKADQHIDHVMGPLQHGRRVYAPARWLAGQAAGRSDIFGKELPARTWALATESTEPAGCCGGTVGNALKAAGRAALALANRETLFVPAEVRKSRLVACADCPRKKGAKCEECGCFLSLKSRLATEDCPLGKWRSALSAELLAHGSKLVHQVWVQGESELPADYARNRREWAAVLPPGWRMVLWDEAKARAEWPDYAAVADKCSHHAMRCDLILARAQRDFGGLAMGTDVRPLQAAALFAFVAATPAFIVANVPGKSASNGVSWFSAPGHPFISEVCRFQLRDIAELANRNVWAVTGPGAWFSVFKSKLWNLATVSDRFAYTRLYNETGVTNPDAWVDAGYAGSWH